MFIQTKMFYQCKPLSLQKYNDTCFSRKNLLEALSSRSHYVCNTIITCTFDFSTFYTTIPHKLLKSRIKELIQPYFSKKNGKQRYQYLVFGRDKSYFVKSYSNSNNKDKQDEIIQMIDFFIYNIFVQFSGQMFQQTIGIPSIRIVFCYLLICFYMRMRQISFKGFTRRKI